MQFPPSREEEVQRSGLQQHENEQGIQVRHLDPFKYVNRNYRQLGLSLPYQLPAETLQMEREYLPNAKKCAQLLLCSGLQPWLEIANAARPICPQVNM